MHHATGDERTDRIHTAVFTWTTSMPGDDMFRCRVCGLWLDDPPWGADGRTPLFDYCPCCGVEFGYQDATAVGAKRFREQWLERGGHWSVKEREPPNWDLTRQLEHIPEGFR